jgi:hypothetical protein
MTRDGSVRVRTAAGLVPLHDALEATALRRTGDFHLIADREHSDVHHVANVVRRNLRVLALRVIETERAQHLGCVVETCLLGVPELGPRRAATARRALALLRLARRALLAVPELHGSETRLVLVRDTEHGIGRGFNDGHGDLMPLVVEHLRHAQLLANDANHVFLD